jgi:transcriptional antiterminator RfaH
MSWYVVVTHSNRESVAKYELENQGYQVYLPMWWKRRKGTEQIRRHGDFRAVPLFSGYLFVNSDCDSTPIWSTRGVSRILRAGENGERLALIDDEYIDTLRSNETDGAVKLYIPPPTTFRSGDVVTIISGPLAGFGVATVVQHFSDVVKVEIGPDRKLVSLAAGVLQSVN